MLTENKNNLDKMQGRDEFSAISELVLTFLGQNALPFSVADSSSFKALLNALKSSTSFRPRILPLVSWLYEERNATMSRCVKQSIPWKISQ